VLEVVEVADGFDNVNSERAYLRVDELAELIEVLEGHVGECALDTPPDLLSRIQFRRVGRYEQRADIAGPPQLLCLMESTVVQEHDLQFGGPLHGELIKEDLEGGRRAKGQLEFKMVPCEGRVGPEEPSGLEDLLKRAHRFDPS